MSEANFSFETYCGNVKVETTEDAMTPFGGLVPWAAFQKKAGIFDQLASTCPFLRTSPNASAIKDILMSLSLTSVCDGSRFSHVDRLRYDPTISELFGLDKVVSDDTIRRFLQTITVEEGRKWFAKCIDPVWSSIPKNFIIDWDSTVQTKYGNQEDVKVGYNPHKKGRGSFHPLLAVVAGTRLSLYYRWRAGNEASASEWIEAMEDCLAMLGPNRRPYLNRGDISFGVENIMKWHEETLHAPKFLFKLKMTKNVKKRICSLPEDQWSGKSVKNELQLADTEIQLIGWSKKRRVVLGRKLVESKTAKEGGTLFDESAYEYEAYVTDLPKETIDRGLIVGLYNKRADCENVFDELKNQWGFNGFCSQHASVTEFAARITLLTYNLWNLFSRLMEPVKHIEASTGRRWFLLIASRLVTTGREKTMKISVSDNWKRMLTDGYKRVYDWLNSTATQLIFGPSALEHTLGLPSPQT